jgi:hypothetical protein
MKIHFFLFILCFAFLSGCSSEPTSTSTIEVSSDGTATISQDNIAVSISNAELIGSDAPKAQGWRSAYPINR